MQRPIDRLNRRQMEHAAALRDISRRYGKWDQGVGADGAHYILAEHNPFMEAGLACENCVFWEGRGICHIIAGQIESMGLCKLWIIPEGRLTE